MKGSVVFFVGAGTSAAMGLPITRHILAEVVDRARKRSLFPSSGWIFRPNDCDELVQFLEMLLPGLRSCSAADLRAHAAVSIIDVLSLVDLMLLTGSAPMPTCGIDKLRRYRQMLECALFCVIRPGDLRPDRRELRRCLLVRMREMAKLHPVTIVSTNYDTLLEQAIFDEIHGPRPRQSGAVVAPRVDLGLRWRDVMSSVVYGMPAKPDWRVFKLHGSMNWLRCALCGYVYVNAKTTIQQQAFRRKVESKNSCDCRHGRLEPVMITPSLIRDIRDGNLLSVWHSAIEALRTASAWVFIGYSLPAEDIAIRSMLLRAFRGRGWKPEPPPAIHVVERGDEARARYEMFFGRSIAYSNDGLAGWLGRPLGR